jgi:hypothetical protein
MNARIPAAPAYNPMFGDDFPEYRTAAEKVWTPAPLAEVLPMLGWSEYDMPTFDMLDMLDVFQTLLVEDGRGWEVTGTHELTWGAEGGSPTVWRLSVSISGAVTVTRFDGSLRGTADAVKFSSTGGDLRWVAQRALRYLAAEQS